MQALGRCVLEEELRLGDITDIRLSIKKFLCFLDLLDRGSILKILRNNIRKRPLIPAVRADRSSGKKIFPDLSTADIAF